MSNDNNRAPSRRNVLQLAGSGLGSVVLFGSASASQRSNENGKLDTDFNPNSPRAVRKFALGTRGLDDEEHRELHEELSSKQIDALREAFSVADIRPGDIEMTAADASGQFDESAGASDTVTSQGTRVMATYSQTATSTLGFDLWTIHHDIIWTYDGDSVYDIASRSRAEEHDFTWGYDGTIDYSFTVRSSSFDSWRQDRFSSDIYQLTCSPHSELMGTASGNAYVKDSSLGGC